VLPLDGVAPTAEGDLSLLLTNVASQGRQVVGAAAGVACHARCVLCVVRSRKNGEF
jgi:hypothetical protein